MMRKAMYSLVFNIFMWRTLLASRKNVEPSPNLQRFAHIFSVSIQQVLNTHASFKGILTISPSLDKACRFSCSRLTEYGLTSLFRSSGSPTTTVSNSDSELFKYLKFELVRSCFRIKRIVYLLLLQGTSSASYWFMECLNKGCSYVIH